MLSASFVGRFSRGSELDGRGIGGPRDQAIWVVEKYRGGALDASVPALRAVMHWHRYDRS